MQHLPQFFTQDYYLSPANDLKEGPMSTHSIERSVRLREQEGDLRKAIVARECLLLYLFLSAAPLRTPSRTELRVKSVLPSGIFRT